MTYAVPNFAKDVRRQVLFFTAGGPLANLLVAAVCLSVAWPAHHRMLTALSASIFVFGLLNATTGLANLVPIRRHYASDGWLLRRWWEGGEDVAAMRRALQVYEQSLRGVLASEIPTRQVEALQADAELGTRMLGHYVALRAAQERGDKRAFATIFELGARELADADKQTYEALRPLWTLFLIEQAFENACAGDQLRPDIDPAVLRMLPSHFTHRLRAAQAWASDDELTWRDALTKAERDAEGSFDHATRRAEAALLQRIRVPRANPAMIS